MRQYPGLTSTSHSILGGGFAGDEEDNKNGDEVNGDKVNWGVLQQHAATRDGAARRGVALTLEGYNIEVGLRGVLY